MRICCEDVIHFLWHRYLERLDESGHDTAQEFANHLGVPHEKVSYDPETDEIVVDDDVDKSLCSLLEPEE